jgi:predicted ArsR family transcriptional regulator
MCTPFHRDQEGSEAMQTTRKHILSILKERGQVTVDELSQELGLTSVTVRHHLDILRGEGLITAPIAHRRRAPGRPKHVYALTEKASAFFPKRYGHLANLVLSEMYSRLSPDEVSQMMKHIGERIASQAILPDEGGFEARFAAAVEFLDGLGYMAHWERHDDGDYSLHIANCPYEQVARQNREICMIDATLLTCLLCTSPQRVSWIIQGDHQCTYTIRPPSETL